MSFDGRNGTRGARQPGGPLVKLVNKLVIARSRRKNGKLLTLGTIGRKSGQERQTPLRWFGGEGSWLIVASAGGAAKNPAWYHNLRADPERVRVEIGGVTTAVTAEQLHGDDYDAAWRRITTEAPQFAAYKTKTDREIPVIRLTPAPPKSAE